MPYVVTTKRPVVAGLSAHPSARSQSRRAVATLEEARDACLRTTRERRDEDGSREAWDAAYPFLAGIETHVRPEGGTVGPLPDGTVIEVGRASYIDLESFAGLTPIGAFGRTDAEIIDAYNAREARP